MLSKSLIQFSVDGWGCVPSLLFDLRPNYGGGNEDDWVLLLKSCACTAVLSASDPAAGHRWPKLPPETSGHSQESLGQSLVGSLLRSPGSWCTQGFISALQLSFAPVLYKSWRLYGGVNGDLLQEGSCHRLCETQVCCTQSPCPCSRPLLTCTSTGDVQTLKAGLAQSVWWVLMHTRFWALQASLEGTGFDSKCDFAPPTILMGLLLFPWRWGIFFWWDPAFSCQWLLLSYL